MRPSPPKLESTEAVPDQVLAQRLEPDRQHLAEPCDEEAGLYKSPAQTFGAVIRSIP